MNFPIESIFYSGNTDGIIRLKVAAICICLDTEDNYEEETEPFLRNVERFTSVGEKLVGPVDPHSFLYLEPTGDFKNDVDAVLNALKVSIDKGQLNTISLRVNLSGEIDIVNTWLSTEDFYEWCESRDFSHGEVCSDYDYGEHGIFNQTFESASDMRKAREAPFFDSDYVERLGDRNRGAEVMESRYKEVILDNLIMRRQIVPSDGDFAKVNDLPLKTRERNTLLAIIAVLCQEVKLDYRTAAKTAAILCANASKMGLSIGESTIENHLKKIPHALEARMK